MTVSFFRKATRKGYFFGNFAKSKFPELPVQAKPDYGVFMSKLRFSYFAMFALVMTSFFGPGQTVFASESTDKWVEVVRVTDNKETSVTSSFAPIKARAAKLVSLKKSSQNSSLDTARVGEITFQGPGGKVNLTGATCSSVYEGGYSAIQVIDGNPHYGFKADGAKGWASADTPQNEPEWLEVTFEKPAIINKVTVTTAPRNPYRLHSYKILALLEKEAEPPTNPQKSDADKTKKPNPNQPATPDMQEITITIPEGNGEYHGTVGLSYSLSFPGNVNLQKPEIKRDSKTWRAKSWKMLSQEVCRITIRGTFPKNMGEGVVKYRLVPRAALKKTPGDGKDTIVFENKSLLEDKVNGAPIDGELPIKSNKLYQKWSLGASMGVTVINLIELKIVLEGK